MIAFEDGDTMAQLHDPGTWSVSWDGQNQNGRAVASGVYFMKQESTSLNDSKKMMLVR
jgi:flagellar hook assembly protein FlgD